MFILKSAPYNGERYSKNTGGHLLQKRTICGSYDWSGGAIQDTSSSSPLAHFEIM